MAAQCWKVDVFVLNAEGTITPKYPKSVYLNIEYDPQGLCIKFINGKLTIVFPFPSLYRRPGYLLALFPAL